jgi:hypothetical protein
MPKNDCHELARTFAASHPGLDPALLAEFALKLLRQVECAIKLSTREAHYGEWDYMRAPGVAQGLGYAANVVRSYAGLPEQEVPVIRSPATKRALAKRVQERVRQALRKY